MKKEGGFILLMVIVVLTAASAALAIASLSARLGAKEVSITIDIARARAASNAVLARAVLGLGENPPLYADGRAYHFIIDDVQISYRLIDTRGLIDLNGADEALFATFFSKFDLSSPDADALAAAIADWRDDDDEARSSGAETRAYQNADLPAPGNRAFFDVSEVRGVLGMSAALYRASAPYLTTGPGNALPDPLMAPDLILELLDISPERRNEILDGRKAGGTPALLDALSDDAETAKTQEGRKSAGIYRLLVEAELPGGTRQAMRLVFSTGPRPGEYAILSRRTLPIGRAAQIYGPSSKDAAF